MFRKETNKQIEEIKIKYATEKKEKAIAVLKNEKQIQELNFQRLSKIKEKEQLIFFGVLLIVLIVASALFYWFHLKQKIILEREMTAQKLFRFQEVIEAQERERKRISEDLHDSLGQILSTIKLNLSSIEDAQFVHEKNNFVIFNNSIKYLDEACQDVRNISHNLMPSSLIRLGLIPALHNLIDSINLGNQFNVSFQNVGLKTRFSELTEINIYRIIQEALNNMMKHSNASEIKIKISQDEENVSIQISDNGVGFNTENLMKAKGIGWKNIYSRVSILNGIITVKSAKNEGVKIYIQFKVPIKSTNDNEKK